MRIRLFVVSFILFVVVLGAKDLTITNPNGGENWMLGGSHTITWTCNLASGTLRITLYDGDTNLGTIATKLPVTQKSVDWTVGKLLNAPDAGAGTNYRIKIRHQGEPYYDFSDAPFTLFKGVQQPPAEEVKKIKFKIRVTSPDATSSWDSGCTYTIRWETLVKNVFKIELYGPKRTRKYDTIGTMLPLPSKDYGGKFAYTWSIPSNYSHLGKCRIRVSTLNGSTTGFSPLFTLKEGTALDIAPLDPQDSE